MTWSAKCPNSEIAAPLAGSAEASHAPTSPNPTATSAARLVSRILLSWLTSQAGFLPKRQDASSVLYHQGGSVGAFPKRQPRLCRRRTVGGPGTAETMQRWCHARPARALGLLGASQSAPSRTFTTSMDARLDVKGF